MSVIERIEFNRTKHDDGWVDWVGEDTTILDATFVITKAPGEGEYGVTMHTGRGDAQYHTDLDGHASLGDALRAVEAFRARELEEQLKLEAILREMD